jgi:hypothetical protein
MLNKRCDSSGTLLGQLTRTTQAAPEQYPLPSHVFIDLSAQLNSSNEGRVHAQRRISDKAYNLKYPWPVHHLSTGEHPELHLKGHFSTRWAHFSSFEA